MNEAEKGPPAPQPSGQQPYGYAPPRGTNGLTIGHLGLAVVVGYVVLVVVFAAGPSAFE